MKPSFDMTPEAIRQYWTFEESTPAFLPQRWDRSAESYGKMELPTEADSLAMRILRREGLLDSTGTCLDVGCGAGRFSFALEQAGWEVTGMDFSTGMLEQCEKLRRDRGSHVTFCQADWSALDLKAAGWEKKFDFVLCHMSPAIRDAETFLKLSQAAKKAVLILWPTRWAYQVERQLLEMLGRKPGLRQGDKAMAYAFSLAWLSSYAPKTDFEDQVLDFSYSLEEAVPMFLRKLEATGPLTAAEAARIRDALTRLSVDGMVHEQALTQIFAMFWRTDGRNYYA